MLTIISYSIKARREHRKYNLPPARKRTSAIFCRQTSCSRAGGSRRTEKSDGCGVHLYLLEGASSI